MIWLSSGCRAMTQDTAYEERRLAIQAELDVAKSQAERNRLGQFATPTGLALDMLAYAKTLLPPAIRVRFLDPAFGTGSFYSALLQTFPSRRIDRAEGFEIDPHYAKPAADMWEDTPLRLHLADFTHTEPSRTESERFNLVICNPPYVRHHHIANDEKLRLRHLTERRCGVPIGGLAGLYCYFLALSHDWMTMNGIAGWLIPSEFMDVNYGAAVKEYLLNQVTVLRIHRFDPHEIQFDNAMVSSAIVWFHKAKPTSEHHVEFTFGGTLSTPAISRMIPTRALRDEPKWTRFPLAREQKTADIPTLGDFLTVKRGHATGNNDFFILAQDELKRYGLPEELFRPILPSPRYLQTDEVLSDEDGRPLVEPQTFLLDCDLPQHIIKAQYPTLWAYLETGKARGVHERYLCRHRTPWYAQEHRPPSLFLCTYMGRRKAKRDRPFRFILNHSKATVPNVYLVMYPKPMLAREIEVRPSLARKIWEALNRIPQEVILGEGRVYGGGLHKLEPKELENVPTDVITTLLPCAVGRNSFQMGLWETDPNDRPRGRLAV